MTWVQTYIVTSGSTKLVLSLSSTRHSLRWYGQLLECSGCPECPTANSKWLIKTNILKYIKMNCSSHLHLQLAPVK